MRRDGAFRREAEHCGVWRHQLDLRTRKFSIAPSNAVSEPDPMITLKKRLRPGRFHLKRSRPAKPSTVPINVRRMRGAKDSISNSFVTKSYHLRALATIFGLALLLDGQLSSAVNESISNDAGARRFTHVAFGMAGEQDSSHDTNSVSRSD